MEEIKDIISGKEYFTKVNYFVECAKLNEKRKYLDEKRQQYEDDIYELKKILDSQNTGSGKQ